MNSAFVCLTSDHIVARSLAFLQSLERVNALKHSKCFILCFDNESHSIISNYFDISIVKALKTDEIPGLEKIISRPIAQLAYASKPFLLDYIFKYEGIDKAVYIDSDTWFINDPSFIFDYLDLHNILLIPAVLNAEETIQNWQIVTRNAQKTGYYNAGFVGCNRKANEFIEWWIDRCVFSTGTDYYREIHGDQKYLNWVPSLFSQTHILRNRGLNVKNFSTNHETFSRDTDSSPHIGKDKVIFFHFSQNLGNLLLWPDRLQAEVSEYLSEVEKARIICKKDYVDMSARINSGTDLPLLPRSGHEFKLLNTYKILENFGKNISGIPSKIIVKCGKILLSSLKHLIIKRYLSKWYNIQGDLNLEFFHRLRKELLKIGKKHRITFWGVSGFAVYLAFFGKKIQVIDPFQGYFNSRLKKLFNPQYSKAEEFAKFLGIGSNINFQRIAFSTTNNIVESEISIISARLGLTSIKTIAKKLKKSQKTISVLLLYNSEFHADYIELSRSTIINAFSNSSVVCESHTGFDILKINNNLK